MKKQLYIFIIGIVLFAACKSQKNIHTKPDWVQNRPTNELYYIGIGIASKIANPTDFQQIAKKNAVNDLISEIKVTVSSNSVLTQYQHNKEFSQQFESDVKITALNTIEDFNVVGSWEDVTHFWIYYRLSKDEYKAIQRRKLMAAIEQAENYFTQSASFSKAEYMQSIRLKVKALAALQLYLNEDIQTTYNGKNIYLVNELVNSIQTQLYEVELKSIPTIAEAKTGKAITKAFEVTAKYKNGGEPIPFFPLTLSSEQNSIKGTQASETDQYGNGAIAISKITNKAPFQVAKIMANMKSIIKVDSICQTLQQILLSLDVPSTNIRLNVSPLLIYVQANEQNLSKVMSEKYVTAALQKKLGNDGCAFVQSKEEADFILTIKANTKAEGIIWGEMKRASLDLTITVKDQTTQQEIYSNALRDIKGFQTTDENAGIDAYKTGTKQLIENLYPSLQKELMQ